MVSTLIPLVKDKLGDNTASNIYKSRAQLALLFKHYVTRGHISLTLMVSTLIPLVKDKLGDNTASNIYKSRALGSLILKVFDWVVLLLYSDDLKVDELQFGFQQKPPSTSM